MNSFIITGVFIIHSINTQFSLSSFDYHNISKIKSFNIESIVYKYKLKADSNWSKYGPLDIHVDSKRLKKNYRIFQAYNSESNPIYIAINCDKKLINVTNQRLKWKSWESPIKGFEFKMIKDLC